MEKYFRKAYRSFTRLPDKKRYLELITASLSVPVLATAIILNFNNLKTKGPEVTPTPSVQERIIYVSPSTTENTDKSPEECTQEIAPIAISSPEEGEIVTENPVNIGISYRQGSYCAAVWSYRLNNGRWSDYSDRSVALYNLPQGNIKFDLRVKSIVTGEEKTLTRSFTYNGPSSQNPPVASSSAQ